MRPSNVSSASHFLVFVRNLTRQFFRRAFQRRVVCCAVALNLLLWPGPGLITRDPPGPGRAGAKHTNCVSQLRSVLPQTPLFRNNQQASSRHYGRSGGGRSSYRIESNQVCWLRE